jgi:hypothetical protein
MTMPHLENCLHSETGWCLDCVKRQWDELDYAEIVNAKVNRENELLRNALRSARLGMKIRGMTTREFARMCCVRPSLISEWTGDKISTDADFVERSHEQ